MDTGFQPLNSLLTIRFICCFCLSNEVSQKRGGKLLKESFPSPKNVLGLHCTVPCFCFAVFLYGICVASGMECARIMNHAKLKANPSRFSSGPLGGKGGAGRMHIGHVLILEVNKKKKFDLNSL